MIFGFKKKVIHFIEQLITKNFLFFLKLILCKLHFDTKNQRKIFRNNVAIINTFQLTGGAAKVATTLFKGLGEDFSMQYYVKKKQSSDPRVVEIQQEDYSFFLELLRREAVNKGWLEFTGFHALNLLKDIFFQQSKLVHLHNLHGEFFSPALFSSVLSGKKVIWTLHDERILTGHCSCTLGCDRWKLGCGNCPDLTIYPSVNHDQTILVLKETKKWVTNLNPVIVCPSEWLSNRVKIAYPSIKTVCVIPNGIDTSVFRPMNRSEIRNELQLPLDKKIIVFVAEFSTNNPFKGGSILRSLIKDSEFENVLFVTIGGEAKSDYLNHFSFPYIEDEQLLAKLYATSDVLLYPTQADNFPLVVLESMACGTPVIASNLGGIPEIIRDSRVGCLIDQYTDKQCFKQELLRFLDKNEEEMEFMRSRCVQLIQKEYSKEKMLKKYGELYTKMQNDYAD
jgi:glycosyltransferase involved in cell wall biosynthesis